MYVASGLTNVEYKVIPEKTCGRKLGIHVQVGVVNFIS